MTGAELAAIRKAAGLSQTELAQRAGIGRHAVSYWECKPQIHRYAWAVRCIAKVLALPDDTVAVPARVCHTDLQTEETTRKNSATLAMLRAVETQIAFIKSNRRVRCGAKTRKNTTCRKKSEPGKRRCKFHGGRSTGAKTAEGIARIAEAQRLRWAKWKVERPISVPGKQLPDSNDI